MLNLSARPVIRLRGVRHNNLKNFDLDLPLKQLVVITGLSGSGKSSLAFDTLFAEGQRRYIETFSPYARQFFDRMDKPQVDSIEGIPPAVAIEQRNSVRTTRSTVGTMTEICDYMKVLWPQIAELRCRKCGQRVRKEPPQEIWKLLQAETSWPGSAEKTAGSKSPEVLITFDLPLTEKLSLEESLALVAKQGYQRLLINGQPVRIEEAAAIASKGAHAPALTVIQDRVPLTAQARSRFVEACEQAYHFGKGKLVIRSLSETGSAEAPRPFSNRLHCATCDLEYPSPSPSLFSFNNPVGACPACKGFGRIISIDYDLALPDRSRTLQECVVKPWLTGMSAECQTDLLRACREFKIPTNVPFNELPQKWQRFVIEGEPDYGKDKDHEWPRAWYGVKGYFRWLESKSYKMHVRVLLSRYRAYTPCPDCQGKRFKPESLLFRLNASDAPANSRFGNVAEGLTLADVYQMPVRDALQLVTHVAARHRLRSNDPLRLVLNEVSARLGYLNEVGLGYLTLDRPTRSLSGGETERVNLTTCLGTRLVNTLFVLDEPSVGLHPRDSARLVRILEHLRDAGNTVVVVEHEAVVIRAADQIIDLGPGHGATGGEVTFQGSFREVLGANSLTGEYLSGRKRIELPPRRSVRIAPETGDPKTFVLNDHVPNQSGSSDSIPLLRIRNASKHNLRNLTVEIPLRRFIGITGVSGSGKTTLVREVLLPALNVQLQGRRKEAKASDRFGEEEEAGDQNEFSRSSSQAQAVQLQGADHIERVVLVDQSTLGKTPRSNPALYVGAFDYLRDLFAESDAARRRGFGAGLFSFNSPSGQCERCRGAGFEKIEMQFLSDVFIRCPECNGRRYRAHILEVKISPEHGGQSSNAEAKVPWQDGWSVADLLEATVDEALDFLAGFSDSRPARRAWGNLQLLQEVGLGYLKLGQPINTLSGGESQRLKLVRHLAEAEEGLRGASGTRDESRLNHQKSLLFLFDEPTTGLHFDDVRVLLKVFQRLVDAGHSVVVIEHNLDVIKSADWLIDLGPEAGDEGGNIVATGTPEDVSCCDASHTGQALRAVLKAESNTKTKLRTARGKSIARNGCRALVPNPVTAKDRL
jgi:excinuclease ABC subunit A